MPAKQAGKDNLSGLLLQQAIRNSCSKAFLVFTSRVDWFEISSHLTIQGIKEEPAAFLEGMQLYKYFGSGTELIPLPGNQ